MSFLDQSQVSRLRAGALSAIWYSHTETFEISPTAHRSRPPEEDFIASLIVLGLPRLMLAWRPFFKKWKLQFSLTGVFCHQTPKAEFVVGTKKESPELADVLFVRRNTNRTGQVRQVASLIQAKMSPDGDLSLPKGDPQLYLLSHWPSFQIKGLSAPSKKFAIGRAERQALYAAISPEQKYPEENLTWPDACASGTLPPAQRGSVEKSLASFLVDLLNFEEGREFYDPRTTACDWSELISYLLRTTFSMPLRTRDITFPHTRGITVDLNRTVFCAKEGSFNPAFFPPRVADLAAGGSREPPDERAEAEFADGGQGRAIIIETSEIQD